MVKESRLFQLYTFCIFLLFLDAMYPWYMWGNSVRQITTVITVCVTICIGLREPEHFYVAKKHLVWAFLLLFSLSWNVLGGDGGAVISLLKFFIWIYLFALIIEDKQYILRSITKWTALLLLLSLTFYLLFYSGILSITPSLIIFDKGQYVCSNYYAFMQYANLGHGTRFMGVFMEPGHMTMGIVPLIMANRFDLKNKYVWILFVSELFTLSLAGYVTLFAGYLLFHGSMRSLKPIFGGVAFIGVLLYLIDLVGFSDYLQSLIWDRLEVRDGEISGNNRVSAEFERVYQSFIHTSSVWTGNSGIDIGVYSGVSGYKKYLVQNGIIGLLLGLLVYTFAYLKTFKYDIGVFTLILLMLLFQNSYPYWFCMMCMYILGCENLKNKKITR